MNKHAVVRTDNLHGTYNGSALVTFRYNNGSAYAAIDNGNVVSLDSKLPEIGRDMWKAVKPTANQKIGKLVLVASVEIDKTDNNANLDDFTNEAGADCRGYILDSGDEFSITEEAISGKPDASSNKYLDVTNDTKWTASSADTNAVAELEAIENDGGYTYYVFRVI